MTSAFTGSSSKSHLKLSYSENAHFGLGGTDVRPFEVGNDQAPQRCQGQRAGQGLRFEGRIRQVEVAARERGGGDVDTNASLRTMYQKAREASVPLDTIERAIKRGTGELEGVRYEAISYEGYGPDGVAVIVETLTDNRNRTSAEIKHVFARNGGTIAEPGAVSWQFDRKGLIEVKGPLDEDQLLEWVMEAGGENFESNGENYLVTTEPHEDSVRCRATRLTASGRRS